MTRSTSLDSQDALHGCDLFHYGDDAGTIQRGDERLLYNITVD